MGCDDDDGDSLSRYRASGDSKDHRSSAAALRRKVVPISGAYFGRIGTPPSKWREDHPARRRTPNVAPSAGRLQKRCRDIPWANWHSAEHGLRTVGARLGFRWSATLPLRGLWKDCRDTARAAYLILPSNRL